MKLLDYKSKWVIPYVVAPYKGRRFDTQRKIRVYRNLNGDNWSIWQDGLVRAHAMRLMLTHCDFKVSRAGWARSVLTGRRNVHAFVEGFLAHSAFGASPLEPEGSKFITARYNRQKGLFETVNFVPHVYLKSADAVLFHPGGIQTIMFDGW